MMGGRRRQSLPHLSAVLRRIPLTILLSALLLRAFGQRLKVLVETPLLHSLQIPLHCGAGDTPRSSGNIRGAPGRESRLWEAWGGGGGGARAPVGCSATHTSLNQPELLPPTRDTCLPACLPACLAGSLCAWEGREQSLFGRSSVVLGSGIATVPTASLCVRRNGQVFCSLQSCHLWFIQLSSVRGRKGRFCVSFGE